MHSKLEFDCLFGSAYKGISIAAATSIALYNYYNLNIPYVFNRKEAKTHGERGIIIGQSIKNKKIIILDDVITSGISINHSIKIVEKKGGKVVSIIVLFDRQEAKTTNYLCTKKTILNQNKINAIISMHDLTNFLYQDHLLKKYMPNLIKYQKKYGII